MNTMEVNMKGRYADVIAEKFEEMDIHFMKKINEEEVIFLIPMPADNAPGLMIQLITDMNGDAKLRCYFSQNVPASRRNAVIKECNRLNSIYRYICLSLDADGDVCSAYDFVLFGDEETVTDHVISMLFLFLDITDKCIPPIMKKMWGEETEESEQDYLKMNLFQTEGGEV
jgi:hypothetical protein